MSVLRSPHWDCGVVYYIVLSPSLSFIFTLYLYYFYFYFVVIILRIYFDSALTGPCCMAPINNTSLSLSPSHLMSPFLMFYCDARRLRAEMTSEH